MPDQELRDRTGKLIGRIKTRSNGKLEIRDHNGRLRVTYDPKKNEKRDAPGKPLGKGNLLARLL